MRVAFWPRALLPVTSKGEADRKSSTTCISQAQASGRQSTVENVSSSNFPTIAWIPYPLEVVKVVEEPGERLRPEVIYTHHPGDLNVDHGVVHRAVLTATRPLPGLSVREIYAFEVPSSTEWAFQRLEPVFRANVFVDITATLETKVAALACYEGEGRPFPHPRSPEALRAMRSIGEAWRGARRRKPSNWCAWSGR